MAMYRRSGAGGQTIGCETKLGKQVIRHGLLDVCAIHLQGAEHDAGPEHNLPVYFSYQGLLLPPCPPCVGIEPMDVFPTDRQFPVEARAVKMATYQSDRGRYWPARSGSSKTLLCWRSAPVRYPATFNRTCVAISSGSCSFPFLLENQEPLRASGIPRAPPSPINADVTSASSLLISDSSSRSFHSSSLSMAVSCALVLELRVVELEPNVA